MIGALRLAVVGLGYWGPNLARAACDVEDVEVTVICDVEEEALAPQARRYPGARATCELDAVLEADDVDGVVLATPVGTHYELARRCLEAGKHVLVEKPLAGTADECERLIELAGERELLLMPGHTFLYSPPVLRVKRMLDAGELGKLYFATSTRVNLGVHQKDVSVVRDLGPHDFSIFLHWLGSPEFVRAVARDAIITGTYDVAFIDLIYPDRSLVRLELSWLSPMKLRHTVLVGTDRMIVYDDTDREQVRIFDSGADLQPPHNFGEWQLQYRTGDIVSPHIDSDEPLRLELQDFADCIREGRTPRSSAEVGLEVVRMIEAAEASLLYNGAPVPLGTVPEERRLQPDRRRNVCGRPVAPIRA